MRIFGFLQIFYSEAVIPRTIVDSPAFLEYGSAEKIAVCALYNPCSPQGGLLEAFWHEGAPNFGVFSNIQNRN
jgi:hypothetical protein